MRIFVLGDSFADNLFKIAYESIYSGNTDQIINYVRKLDEHGIDKALWFTDWLEKWGYEVINLGKGGSSNEDIYYQFSKLDDFREGDRMIVWWTSINRFIWFNEYGEVWVKGHSVNEESPSYIIDQALSRATNMEKEDGYVNKNIIPFIKHITNVHSKYKPIITSFCPKIQEKIQDNPYFFSFNVGSSFLNLGIDYFQGIKLETNGHIDDGHNGRTLNYIWAMGIDEIIKSELDGGYLNNSNLHNTIRKRILTTDVTFKNPPEWV